MITPTKYMDMDACLLVILEILIKFLKKNKKIARISSLKDELKKKTSHDEYKIDIDILNALSVLYLLGKIDYVEKTDSIELTI